VRRAASILRQRGAALLIVLLLVATLSFIVMSIADRMSLASSRSANTRVRAELLWRLVGAETLVKSAIEAAVRSKGFRFVLENTFFTKTSEIPMDGGGALIRFKDATACFNVNVFARSQSAQSGGAPEAQLAEFVRLIDALNLEGDDPKRLAAVIADWIDPDDFQTPQGAEDDYYSGLPAPYRTGGGAIADVSELRAVADIDSAAFQRLRPFLCALPQTGPAPLNINMLTKEDAPILAALAGDGVALAAAEAAIENRPAGGYASPEQFWSDGAFAGKNISEEARGRVSMRSQYIEAEAAIRHHDQRMTVHLLLEVSENGEVRLVSRLLGPVFE